jgi:hypothetical protein
VRGRDADRQGADLVASMSPDQLKIYESRLRRAAARQGLELCKSRLRDPRARGYGGYILLDGATIGFGAANHPYDASIDEIAQFLST